MFSVLRYFLKISWSNFRIRQLIFQVNSRLWNPGYSLNKVFDESVVPLEDIVLSSENIVSTDPIKHAPQDENQKSNIFDKIDAHEDSGISDGEFWIVNIFQKFIRSMKIKFFSLMNFLKYGHWFNWSQSRGRKSELHYLSTFIKIPFWTLPIFRNIILLYSYHIWGWIFFKYQ